MKTQQDIIDLANEHGVPHRFSDTFAFCESDLLAFAKAIEAPLEARIKELEAQVAAEREACAKVCEAIDAEYEGEDVLATWCAKAIRARGNAPVTTMQLQTK